MSTVNVNRNANDPSDNILRRYNPQRPNPKEYALAYVLIGGFIFIVWVILWVLMKIECYWECGSMSLVWQVWSVVTGILAVSGLIASLYNWSKNSAFIDVASIRLHRNDIRNSTAALIENDKVRAESEATAGIDTWSPSNHYSSTVKEDKNNGAVDTAATFSDEIPLALLEKL